MSRRPLAASSWCAAALLSLLPAAAAPSSSAAADVAKPNILIVTVDDMNADSIGVYGCELNGTTPNIDAFARTALRFQRAHVQVGNCMPGRNLMWSGLFSHVNGVEGFVQNREPDYPVLCDLAQRAGYFTAIRGKTPHSTPYTPYSWGAVLDQSPSGRPWHSKDPKSYGQSTRRGIELAKEAGKPFCLMVNISDPHKPFYSQTRRNAAGERKDPYVPSLVFSADETPVPGFLPDDETIRSELALYYSSVRCADDCFAEIMAALDESGQQDKTFVMFLSDHGMPFPFAKTQLYHHSTRTPLMVRWPSVTRPGASDDRHMVSAIDFLPTLLDVMEHEHPTPERLHGRSFAPLLRGESQEDRDFVILQYNENSGRNRHPMRGIHTRDHLYLYNPWSDGQRKFATATTGADAYRQMVKRARTEPDIAARLQLFDHRVVEELYVVSRDPDCLKNEIDNPDMAGVLQELRGQLAESLEATGDPVAPLVADVENDALRKAYMKAEDERAARAKRNRAKRNRAKRRQGPRAGRPAAAGKRGQDARLIAVEPPAQIVPGAECDVVIRHDLPAELGKQKLHVTLWEATADGKSLRKGERQVKEITGKDMVTLTFKAPDKEAAAYQFAAFVGEDFPSNLQHLRSSPTPVRRPAAK